LFYKGVRLSWCTASMTPRRGPAGKSLGVLLLSITRGASYYFGKRCR